MDLAFGIGASHRLRMASRHCCRVRPAGASCPAAAPPSRSMIRCRTHRTSGVAPGNAPTPLVTVRLATGGPLSTIRRAALVVGGAGRRYAAAAPAGESAPARPNHTDHSTVGLAMDQVLAYYESHRADFLRRMKDLLRIPSVSAQSAHKDDLRRCAELVRQYLTTAGLQAEIMETGGHPAVVADSGPVEGGGPVVLVYGHYDVQPEGDLNLWHSPPFEPTERDGAVFARGAADDKGQMLTHVFAAECWRQGAGRLPLRLKFLIEGEEEVASAHLESFAK